MTVAANLEIDIFIDVDTSASQQQLPEIAKLNSFTISWL